MDLNQDNSDLFIQSIIQTNQGYMLFGSDGGLLKYDGYQLTPFMVNNKDFSFKTQSIKALFIDDGGIVWVGTRGEGLYSINLNTSQPVYSKYTLDSNYITDIVSGSNNSLWVGTTKGIGQLYNGGFQKLIKPTEGSDENNYVTSLLQINNNLLLVGTKGGLFQYSIQSNLFKEIYLENLEIRKFPIIYAIHKDVENNIWVGTENGIYLRKIEGQEFQLFKNNTINSKTISIASTKDSVWLGTVNNGLYKVRKPGYGITHYKNDIRQSSISDNTVLNFFKSKSNLLWFSTFNKSIDYIDLNAQKFGLRFTSSNNISCAKNKAYKGILSSENNKQLWLINDKGIIDYSETNCNYYEIDNNQTSILSMLIDSKNKMWVTTNHGIFEFNTDKKIFEFLDVGLNDSFISFMVENNDNNFLIPTWEGLYEYNIQKDLLMKIQLEPPNPKNRDFRFYSYTKNISGTIVFATNVGLLQLKGNNFTPYDSENILKSSFVIFSVLFDNSENLWIGTEKNGLFVIDSRGKLINKFDQFNQLPKNTKIYSLQIGKDNSVWAGSNKGLISIDEKIENLHIYHKSDGLQGNVFNLNASYKAPDGKLYFGGINGFNAFYPEDIKLNMTPPSIVLTDFTRFGKSVEVGVEKDGFLLESDINHLNELVLSHKDYVVGFEFAALDYADPSRNKYAYKLEGQDPEWIYTDADNRSISYSNLSSGEYTFRVKGSNKDGTWNEEGKSLKVIVKPAPWFSWWAYVIYIITLYCLISWYFKKKNAENQRLTDLLKSEVERQTQELQTQKQTVEDLLTRKNELFANVSHEFRTPLTLILGPINKLLNSHLPSTDINALKMVNRNANRLLTMIEQLLQLAKVTDNKNIKHYRIKTAAHIQVIVESFVPLAQDKRIDLQLVNNEKAAINTSKDALEIILGNLLSNAIKYTQSGGKISLSSTTSDGKVNIQVKDSGCGLDEQQQKDIFNRFTRLDSHKNIEGIGIGLSVVEDLLKVNNATLEITSKPGEGSTFSVSFAAIGIDFDETIAPEDSLLIKQLSSQTTDISTTENIQQTKQGKQKESILIIDDNVDMRAHIADSIKENYHCYLAGGGKAGIALAIKHVPDIIICDVMMPEMDGFHVSRVLRNDTRTSHIPLMLLTALDDRESRIRGWREHVDVYLTKPFDAQELLLQLENILVIRNILKTKAGQKVKAGSNASNSDLPKRDQEFIDKLNKLITKKYKKPNYLRPQMASDMAVSERQLQRKLKALIDKNPMDLLREYRLSQAAIMLKDGYQVSITSDECGFNSLPHFSKCFKSQFGMSPKVYQKTCLSS